MYDVQIEFFQKKHQCYPPEALGWVVSLSSHRLLLCSHVNHISWTRRKTPNPIQSCHTIHLWSVQIWSHHALSEATWMAHWSSRRTYMTTRQTFQRGSLVPRRFFFLIPTLVVQKGWKEVLQKFIIMEILTIYESLYPSLELSLELCDSLSESFSLSSLSKADYIFIFIIMLIQN